MMRLMGWCCCWCIISSRRSSYSSNHLYLIASTFQSSCYPHSSIHHLFIFSSFHPSNHPYFLSVHPSICHQPNWMLSPCSPSRRVSLCLTSREQGICVLYRPYQQWCGSYMIHADSCINIGKRLRMSYCERRCSMLLQAMLRSLMWILPLPLLNDYDGVMIVIEWWWCWWWSYGWW